MKDINVIYNIECTEGLRKLPSDCIQCCVTSPPYWKLRDYGHDRQMGLETSPDEYVNSLVLVFKQVWRVLKSDGVAWLNLGDTYNAYKANTGASPFVGNSPRPKHHRGLSTATVKNKDLVGIPWMVAFALRNEGWYLRQDCIWHKPNPMPESVTDRCTKAHEYLFLLSKSPKYYFNHCAIRQPMKTTSMQRLSQDIEKQQGSSRIPGKGNGNMKAVGGFIGGKKHLDSPASQQFLTRSDDATPWVNRDGMANKRSVWTVPVNKFKGAHFATFPEALIVDCIKSGSREGDIVLDPFIGTGTTAVVAASLNRKYIGFEINPDYVKMAEKRIQDRLGLFNR